MEIETPIWYKNHEKKWRSGFLLQVNMTNPTSYTVVTKLGLLKQSSEIIMQRFGDLDRSNFHPNLMEKIPEAKWFDTKYIKVRIRYCPKPRYYDHVWVFYPESEAVGLGFVNTYVSGSKYNPESNSLLEILFPNGQKEKITLPLDTTNRVKLYSVYDKNGNLHSYNPKDYD